MCVRNIHIVFCVERLVLAVYLWLTGVCLPTQTDKRPENVYHSYEDAFNPDTASTLEYRLKEDDGKDATVIPNLHGAGDDEDVVVSGAHVDVRKEKALVLENIYMSEDELDEAEPAPAGMEGMVRMCVVYVCLFMCVCVTRAEHCYYSWPCPFLLVSELMSFLLVLSLHPQSMPNMLDIAS